METDSDKDENMQAESDDHEGDGEGENEDLDEDEDDDEDEGMDDGDQIEDEGEGRGEGEGEEEEEEEEGEGAGERSDEECATMEHAEEDEELLHLRDVEQLRTAMTRIDDSIFVFYSLLRPPVVDEQVQCLLAKLHDDETALQGVVHDNPTTAQMVKPLLQKLAELFAHWEGRVSQEEEEARLRGAGHGAPVRADETSTLRGMEGKGRSTILSNATCPFPLPTNESMPQKLREHWARCFHNDPLYAARYILSNLQLQRGVNEELNKLHLLACNKQARDDKRMRKRPQDHELRKVLPWVKKTKGLRLLLDRSNSMRWECQGAGCEMCARGCAREPPYRTKKAVHYIDDGVYSSVLESIELIMPHEFPEALE
jgi:hypothetical protein